MRTTLHLACALAGAVLAAGAPLGAQEAQESHRPGVAVSFQVLGMTPESSGAVAQCLQDAYPHAGAIDRRADGALVVRVRPDRTIELAQLETAVHEFARASVSMEIELSRESVEITSRCEVAFDGVSSPEIHEALLARLGQVEGVVVTSASPEELGRFVIEPAPSEESPDSPPAPPATLRPILETAAALSAESPDRPAITLANAFWTAPAVD